MGQFDDPFGEVVDADFAGVTDVENLADGGGHVFETNKGLDCVMHVAEAAGLFAAAVDPERLILQSCADESRNDHPVAADLAGADSIKEAGDNDGQLAFLVVAKSQ